MCGGRGTRLEAEGEKPLFPVGGRPMVERVLNALSGSRLGRVHAVTSPATPRTRDHLDSLGVPLVEAPGEGYVADLEYALDGRSRPVLTVVADLPLLSADAVDAVLAEYEHGRERGSVTVCVPARLKRDLGVSVDTTLPDTDLAPTGLNVVGDGPDEPMTRDDTRLAVNVNRLGDAAVAEALL
jgi:adenosylcobinamide-phosphate guanylyltransferase